MTHDTYNTPVERRVKELENKIKEQNRSEEKQPLKLNPTAIAVAVILAIPLTLFAYKWQPATTPIVNPDNTPVVVPTGFPELTNALKTEGNKEKNKTLAELWLAMSEVYPDGLTRIQLQNANSIAGKWATSKYSSNEQAKQVTVNEFNKLLTAIGATIEDSEHPLIKGFFYNLHLSAKEAL